MGAIRDLLLGERKHYPCGRPLSQCICGRTDRAASTRKFSGRQAQPRTIRGGRAKARKQYIKPMGTGI